MAHYPLVVLAVDFCRARDGDRDAFTRLLREFDEHALGIAGQPGADNIVVSLFGFFPDWDASGRRLFRYVNRADGAATSMARDSLEWKHHLFGRTKGYIRECLDAAMSEVDELGMKRDTLCPKGESSLPAAK